MQMKTVWRLFVFRFLLLLFLPDFVLILRFEANLQSLARFSIAGESPAGVAPRTERQRSEGIYNIHTPPLK